MIVPVLGWATWSQPCQVELRAQGLSLQVHVAVHCDNTQKSE